MAIIEFGTDRLDGDLEPSVAPLRADLVSDNVTSEPLGAVEEQQPAVVRTHLLPRLMEPLSPWWAVGLVVAWVAIFSTGVILEPAPADPDAALPLVETLLISGLMLGWVAMAVGFAARRRFGALASLVSGVVLIGMTIACPVSGHHSGIGAWWWFEAVGSITLVALSHRALQSA